ncbi:MAG: hypothetical protein K6G36_01860 [Candidatus Saccharibacteria bacterium]|nr:hypothetical protein [Candidatus Saccharibacteria bacterium]
MTIKEYYETKCSDYQKGAEKVRQAIDWLKSDDDKLNEKKKFWIGQIEHRIKTFDSFCKKCLKKGLIKSIDDKNVDTDKIESEIRDIAGVRVICVYIDLLEDVMEAIRRVPGVEVKRTKNYIESPELKPNGYRAIHLELSVQVPDIIRGTISVLVEVQIRTYLQHVWSVAEHAILYKPGSEMPEVIKLVLGDFFVELGKKFVRIDASMVVARERAATNRKDFDPFAYLTKKLTKKVPELKTLAKEELDDITSVLRLAA